MRKTCLVALSGGIDSAVTAALLMNKGYDVVGVTMDTGIGNPGSEAAQVAKELGIRHFILDLKKVFQEKVIDYFVNSYRNGETPNPCVVCNSELKFSALFTLIDDFNADYFATGHYARTGFNNQRHLLYKAKYLPKDQSYVLYSLSQAALQKTIFPLGDYSKNEIREIAGDLGLKVCDKKESQDICFIPDGNYRAFLVKECPQCMKPGDIVDINGNKIGRHHGLANYTIGQRKGLGVALGRPTYVAALDAEKNRIVIGNENSLFSSVAITRNNNFLPFEKLEQSMKVKVKVRYKSDPIPAEIIPKGENEVEIRFESPERAVTPGQSAVYYQDDLVIGGGIISQTK